MAIGQRDTIVVPVLGVVVENGTPVMRAAHGTAFPIGGSLFLTADHVPQEVDAADLVLTIGAGRDGEWLAVKASIHTRWPEVDLAVLEADEPRLEPVDWTTTEVPIFEPVRTLGFPFGADQRHSTLSARGLVGHVAAGRQFPELTGTPEIYELTFAAPRGLSGAPLFQHDGLWVCGCVIKNYTTEIAAIRSAEVHTGRGKVERFETYEYLHLGIAVNSTTILGLKLSSGLAIRDHALRHGAQLR